MNSDNQDALKAACVIRVFFSKDFCFDSETVANCLMSWLDCWQGFRNEGQATDTELGRYYIDWWYQNYFQETKRLGFDSYHLHWNLHLLSTLPIEIQNGILRRLPRFDSGKSYESSFRTPANPLSVLQQYWSITSMPQGTPIIQDGGS